MQQLKHEARAQVSLIQAKSKSDRSQTLVCIVQGSYAIYVEIFFMKFPTQLSRHNVHTGETAAVRHQPEHIMFVSCTFKGSA